MAEKVNIIIGFKNNLKEEVIDEIANASEAPEFFRNTMDMQDKSIDATIEGLRRKGYSYSVEELKSGAEVFYVSINATSYWKFYEDLIDVGREMLDMD